MKYKDVYGMKFGKLTALERVEDRIQTNGRKRVMVKCICECGNVKIVSKDYLLKAKQGCEISCGCVHNEKARKRGFERKGVRYENTSVKVGDKYGQLTVLKRADNTKHNHPAWLCECCCGKQIVVPSAALRRKHMPQVSCGCIEKSAIVRDVEKVLNDLKIDYETEVTIKGCVNPETGNALRFDYRVNGILIEVQGCQHEKSYKSDFGKQQREITDKTKKDFCVKNGIQLYEIWYNENAKEKLYQILNIMPTPCQDSL